MEISLFTCDCIIPPLRNSAFNSTQRHTIYCTGLVKFHINFSILPQPEIVVKRHSLKIPLFPEEMQDVINTGKTLAFLQMQNARFILTEALWPVPTSNDYMCTQKTYLFPLTLMVLPMALSSPVITTFNFIHGSLRQPRLYE